MDAFRTVVKAPTFPFSVDHITKSVLIGSCFAQNIGSKMKEAKFKTAINPFGILFNPFSIMNALERMLNNRPYSANELLKVNDQFVSLDHHGRFNHTSEEESLDTINGELETGRNALLEAKTIFITLGSAWVYEYHARKHTVANCHKIPNKQFTKRLLSFQDVHLILRHIPPFLKAKGIDAQVVFTVSPVRHWKDGPEQNQRSKALLLAAAHEVAEEFDNCHYFPAYEFMMDDLRDYRFYASDMLHPSEPAIEYIWAKFQDSFFTEETKDICHQVSAVVQASKHRPVDPESNSFQRFLKKQLEIIHDLSQKHPTLDLSKEKTHFEHYLF